MRQCRVKVFMGGSGGKCLPSSLVRSLFKVKQRSRAVSHTVATTSQSCFYIIYFLRSSAID